MMTSARRVLVVMATLGAGSLGRMPAMAIDVISQNRQVSVDIDAQQDVFSSCIPFITSGCTPDSTMTTNYPASVSAPDTSPFMATASRVEFPSTFASQDSEITGSTIRASGSHAATASFSNTGGFPITYYSEYHDVETRADVTLELAAATTYTLSGSVTTSGVVFSTSSASIRLVGPSGVVAEVQVDSDTDCIDLSCATVGPEQLASQGTLPAGTYTLTAAASGTAGGAHSTLGSFGTGVDGEFDVELALSATSIPTLAAGAEFFLALLLPGTGVLLRRRSHLAAYTAAGEVRRRAAPSSVRAVLRPLNGRDEV